MKLIKTGILFIKIVFKLIIDTWKLVAKHEKDWKHFSKYLKSVKEYQREMEKEKISKPLEDLTDVTISNLKNGDILYPTIKGYKNIHKDREKVTPENSR